MPCCAPASGIRHVSDGSRGPPFASVRPSHSVSSRTPWDPCILARISLLLAHGLLQNRHEISGLGPGPFPEGCCNPWNLPAEFPQRTEFRAGDRGGPDQSALRPRDCLCSGLVRTGEATSLAHCTATRSSVVLRADMAKPQQCLCSKLRICKELAALLSYGCESAKQSRKVEPDRCSQTYRQH